MTATANRVVVIAVLSILAAGCDQMPFSGDWNEAQWTVEPGFVVDEETTEIPLLIVEVECASGRDAVGRTRVEVDYAEDAISIRALVQRLEGDQECPGNPPTPQTLELDEPIGNRELVNGATSEIARRPPEIISD